MTGDQRPQAENADLNDEAIERQWGAWNDPVLMQQRAADAATEAESMSIWEESRIGLRGALEAEVDEPSAAQGEVEPEIEPGC